MVYITHIRTFGGSSHEHITHVKWRNPQTGEISESTVAAMIDWIEKKNGAAFVSDGKSSVSVLVVEHRFLRTKANNTWTDNLLSLPRF